MMVKPTLSFRAIERHTARSLRRVGTPGVGVGMGRRSAYVELWQDQSERYLARFTTAREKAWFTVDTCTEHEIAVLNRAEWDSRLAERLIDWLCEVMDDQYGD